MGDVDSDLLKLFAGEVVPLDGYDISYDTHKKVKDDYVPIVKRTIGYIAMAIVFDDEGRVLLIQEAKERIRGQWYIPAGRVEPDENLVDGVRREVLEEAGIEIEPISMCCLEMCGSLGWYRFAYVAKQSGGKLKTLAEQDQESLQAQWFTVKEIMHGNLKLRAKDFFKIMLLAQEYLSTPDYKRHPPYQINIQPHSHILMRCVLLRENDGSCDVLCCKKNKSHLPVIKLDPRQYCLSEAMCHLYKNVFSLDMMKDRDIQIPVTGLLTLEHCGVPAREHDGVCFTTVFLVGGTAAEKLNAVTNEDYSWHTVINPELNVAIARRVFTQNLLIPIKE